MGTGIMTEDTIILNAAFTDRWEAIEACGRVLVQQGYVTVDYIEDMKERERLGSVYVGNHVAIPHGVSNSEKSIRESGISLIQIPEGVDFGTEKAYIMIGIAGKDGSHIELLSNIAIICMEEANIELLRTTEDKGEILKLFTGTM